MLGSRQCGPYATIQAGAAGSPGPARRGLSAWAAERRRAPCSRLSAPPPGRMRRPPPPRDAAATGRPRRSVAAILDQGGAGLRKAQALSHGLWRRVEKLLRGHECQQDCSLVLGLMSYSSSCFLNGAPSSGPVSQGWLQQGHTGQDGFHQLKSFFQAMYDRRGCSVCRGEERVHHPPANAADAAAVRSRTCLTVHVSVMVGFAPGKKKIPTLNQSIVKNTKLCFCGCRWPRYSPQILRVGCKQAQSTTY